MWRAGKTNSSKLIFWWIACRCWSLWTTKHWVKEWFSVQRAILASKRVKYSVEHFGRGLESVCFVFSKCRRCQKWSDVQSNSQHQLRGCSQHEQRRAGEPPSPGGRLTLLSTYSPFHLLLFIPKRSLLHLEAGNIFSDLLASTFVFQTVSSTDNKRQQAKRFEWIKLSLSCKESRPLPTPFPKIPCHRP